MKINTLFRFSLPLLLLLASIDPLCAQPTLQEWWRAPERMVVGRGISYLPNFYNGKGAMAIMHNGRGETWLNRFPGDTFSIFNWKGGLPIRRADLDGDGLLEYIDNAGYIYKAVPGSLPDSVPVHQISIPTKIYYIGDVNNDGTDDILLTAPGNGNGLSLIAGNKDIRLVKTQESVITAPYSSNTEDKIVSGVYKAKDNTLRIITWRITTTDISILYPYEDNFDIYKAEFVQGESKLKSFNHIGIIPGQKTGRVFGGTAFIFRPTPSGPQWVYLIHDQLKKMSIYSLDDDIFTLISDSSSLKGMLPKLLYPGVYNDTMPGFAITDNLTFYVCSAIDAQAPTIPIGKAEVKGRLSDGRQYVGVDVFSLIDDVNNDGIRDLAVGLSISNLPNTMRIYLLPPQAGTGIASETVIDMGTVQSMPLPVQGACKLIFKVAGAGNYTITAQNITGGTQYTLHNFQSNSAGQQQEIIDCSSLPSGIYMLRIQDINSNIHATTQIIIQH